MTRHQEEAGEAEQSVGRGAEGDPGPVPQSGGCSGHRGEVLGRVAECDVHVEGPAGLTDCPRAAGSPTRGDPAAARDPAGDQG